MKEKIIYWKKKIAHWLRVALEFILNPRLLLCFGIGWIITNGWSYIFLAVGTACGIPWMVAVAGAYMAFLWFPFTPEKVITVIIAMFLLKVLFPNDQKTLKKLKDLYAKYHELWVGWKEKRKQKKAEAKSAKERGKSAEDGSSEPKGEEIVKTSAIEH